MTPEQFISAVIKYYGKYSSDFKRDMVLQYLREMKTDDYRAALFRLVLLNVSDRYGKAPDIASIEEVQNTNKLEIRKAIVGPKWVVIEVG